ncbi:MAG TPA: TlyA family RNA methyltransferase [Methylomirabilota bacterium]|jgi:23S rRNA (cytidine1920-2'-O)/16S rRNA (cytidine1409-2'-O)-methyltransferase|nr:TlyA family RNA methyltransferase [Methylomirabilota bacterium]
MKRSPRRRGLGAAASAPKREATPPGKRGATPPKSKERLDVMLVSRGLTDSREKAARLILAGQVMVDGQRMDKAGTLVDNTAPVQVAAAQKFVSRGGEKLAPVLDVFGVSARGRTCLDVGASTGGFTQCLLERGAARVYAVDVGHGQLDSGLRVDGRVVVMEKTNARHLLAAAFAEPPELATVDVSFISLEKVLPSIFGVLTPHGEAVALVKPQFEVGKGQVGKGGVVRDPAHHAAVLERVARFAILHGWHVRGVAASPLKGPKGNREFFLHLTKTGRTLADLGTLITRATAEEPV